MLTNFKLISRTPGGNRRYENGCYIAACHAEGEIARASCAGPVALNEVVLFQADFEGKPVVGAFFVLDDRVEFSQCEVVKLLEKAAA